MSRRLVATIVVALAVVGCVDDREQSPTSPEVSAVPDLMTTGAACKYSDVKKYARNLFGSPSAGYTLAQQMSLLPPNEGPATAKAFDIFAAIAKKRNDAYLSSTDANVFTGDNVTDAANLTVQTIACANVSATATVAIFEQALESKGGYEVRGAGVEGQVLAADKQAAVFAPAVGGFATWLRNGRALFYGYPLTTLFPLGESTAGIAGRVSYDWSLIRPAGSLALVGNGKVSLCVVVDDAILPPGKLRVQKEANILEFTPPPLTCNVALLQTASANTGPLGERLAKTLLQWVSPTPLYAAFLAKGTSPTGSAGSFSGFQVVNPDSVNLTFKYSPVDGHAGTAIQSDTPPNPVTVEVKGEQGVPWTGVLIRLYGVNNNGSKVQFFNDTATTDLNGLAKFPTFNTDKTGGLSVFAATQHDSADGDVTAFVADTVEADDRINIRP